MITTMMNPTLARTPHSFTKIFGMVGRCIDYRSVCVPWIQMPESRNCVIPLLCFDLTCVLFRSVLNHTFEFRAVNFHGCSFRIVIAMGIYIVLNRKIMGIVLRKTWYSSSAIMFLSRLSRILKYIYSLITSAFVYVEMKYYIIIIHSLKVANMMIFYQ